jgi:hypothetical protein
MQRRDLLKRISIVAAVAAVGASGVTSAQLPEDIVVDDLKYISTEADGERVQLTPAKFNAHSETSDLIKMTDDAFSFYNFCERCNTCCFGTCGCGYGCGSCSGC